MKNNEIGRVVQNSSTKVMNNIVSGETLRSVQGRVLKDLKNAIIPSMGPGGSNTLILRGNSSEDIVAEYSKDGNKIIKNIKYQYPIEMAIKSEVENATRRIEKEVGDGTSSIVVMSSLIFDALCEAEQSGKLSHDPYSTMREFKSVVSSLSDRIKNKGKECTIQDIYDIAYISTNGNEYISNTIADVYRDYGMNVFIDVSASTNENTYLKSYNGVTIEAGFSDPAMINNLDRGSCRIRGTESNPIRIYYFAEPIDTPEQLALFQQIIESNIFEPRFKSNMGVTMKEIPTVILAPQISRDAEAYMRRIIQMLHQFDEAHYSQKPQLLIITNYMGLDENYADHIATLCGCKPIKKYIDDSIQKKDQESGLAPTLDTICDFCGSAEEVEADTMTTKFVNPDKMYEKDSDGKFVVGEDGNFVYSSTYTNIVNFLEAQYKSLSSQGGNVGTLGSLKRQLNAVKSNMVELFIGGISISDRDSLRDLVEDAVLNTRSAAKNGVGYGANTMGFITLTEELAHVNPDELNGEEREMFEIKNIIWNAYRSAIASLYSTVYSEDYVNNYIIDNIIVNDGKPLNITTNEFDGKVLTSIASEPAILDTISKIITIMFTANQAILQAPSLSVHY